MIARLNEKTYKCSIKTTMLGKDAAMSEYWHFKDDNTRIYIRMETHVPIMPDNVEMAHEDEERNVTSAENMTNQKESTQVDSTNR